MRKNTITGILCKPGEKAELVTIPHTLESLQELVGGFIEFTYPFNSATAIMCNEEGRINGMPPCRSLVDDDGKRYDILFGPLFIVGTRADDICDLPPKRVEEFMAKFGEAEEFGPELEEEYRAPKFAFFAW